MYRAFLVCTALVHTARASPRFLQDSTIADVLAADPNYSTLVSAASSVPGLIEILSEPSNVFTVFAPDNDSFAALDQDMLAKLLTPPWEAHLYNLLRYHAADGNYLAADLTDGTNLTMLNYELIDISMPDGTVSIGNQYVDAPFSTVTVPDTIASNGVVHGVSGVFLPSFLFLDLFDLAETAPAVVGTLSELITLAGLEDTIRQGEFTVLEPNNDAFAALGNSMLDTLTDPDNVEELRKVVLYHFIPELLPRSLFNNTDYTTVEGSPVAVALGDSSIMVNDATILYGNIVASNGVVHVIDQVLLPPDLNLPVVTSAPATAPVPTFGEPMQPTASEPQPSPYAGTEPTSAAVAASLVIGWATALAALFWA